jgi:cation diffusion facilitator family transporter
VQNTPMSLEEHSIAEKEKRGAALSSVLAAIFLTGMKLAVGLLTNSLGILAEAAHSALDLVAAFITFLAVRVAGRQPDREHPYGYGKVENLSALIETLLLLVTCGWIIYEAIERLFFKTVSVETSIWSFLVMGTSIIVDVSRSRMLIKVAKKHNSQALEADALHFSTDVWSSSVVIVGLLLVALYELLVRNYGIQLKWLHSADAGAALGVSAIVIYVSIQLGQRTVAALVDRAPQGMIGELEQALQGVVGISEVTRVRVRHSGPAVFADVTISIPRSASFEEAHRIATQAETIVQQRYPRSDVVVHVDPISQPEETMVESLWGIAALQGLSVHSIRAHELRGRLHLDMHVEVPERLTLGEAHDLVTQFEASVREEIPEAEEIVTHIEPVGDLEVQQAARQVVSKRLERAVSEVARQMPALSHCHNVRLLQENGELVASIHCNVDPSLPVTQAHQLSQQFESLLRTKLPKIKRVTVHLEPPNNQEN